MKLWPWIGSEIRSTAFLTTHKCCGCAPSKLSALTALMLWALTLHHKLKVGTFGHLWHTQLSFNKEQQWGMWLWHLTEPPYPPETFDRVLLDAPCSGLGQRPNMGCTWSLKEISSYQPLQRKLFQAVGVYSIIWGWHILTSRWQQYFGFYYECFATSWISIIWNISCFSHHRTF